MTASFTTPGATGVRVWESAAGRTKAVVEIEQYSVHCEGLEPSTAVAALVGIQAAQTVLILRGKEKLLPKWRIR